MEKNYRAQYPELFKKHWWWRARADAIIDTLRRRRPPGGWGTILDVGCGDGLFFDRLAELGEVEGIDLPEAFTGMPPAHRGRVYVRPFDDTFQPGRHYALILMLDVLEHLPDPVAALLHALALLSSTGTLLVTVPAFRLLWTNHDVINQHLTRYSRSTFRNIARQAGLHIEEEQYWFQWTCPAKLAIRTAEGLLRLPPATPKVPPHLFNEFLYRLSRLERKALGRLPIPFGSTLMVLGSKRPA